MIRILILCLSMITFFQSGCTEQANKFRIGFEFQTAGKILGDDVAWKFQKVPLFKIMKDGDELFHVELDGGDIEFVTAVFNENDLDKLSLCMKVIEQISNILSKKEGRTLGEFLSDVATSVLEEWGGGKLSYREANLKVILKVCRTYP